MELRQCAISPVGVQPSTVYDIYRSVSLIRFDSSGLPNAKVESARLRVYVPRNLTQMVPVPIHVHAVSAANAGWQKAPQRLKKPPPLVGIVGRTASRGRAGWDCPNLASITPRALSDQNRERAGR